MFTTWIRVENDHGQFDIREDAPLPDGARLVEGYPVHYGTTGRPGKSRIDLRELSADLETKKKPELVAEAKALGLEVASSATKADLIDQITAHQNADDTTSSETGETTHDDAGEAGSEQEN